MTNCEEALQQVKDTTERNKRMQDEHINKRHSYEKSVNKKREWEKCKNELNCGGEYSRFSGKVNDLRNDRRFWTRCVAHEESQSGRHDDWCRNDFGDDWKHVGQDNGGCSPGFTKGLCGRTDDGIRRDLGIENRPGTESDPGNFSPIPVPEIKCCQEMTFKGISANKVNFDNLNQTCNIVTEATGGKQSVPNSNQQSVSKKTILIMIVTMLIILGACSAVLVVVI